MESIWFWILWGAMILAALAGWFLLDKPSRFTPSSIFLYLFGDRRTLDPRSYSARMQEAARLDLQEGRLKEALCIYEDLVDEWPEGSAEAIDAKIEAQKLRERLNLS